MSRKAEQSEATRAALVAAARALYTEREYSQVGTEEIVRRARVTRGALYHHFKDKRDLFRAAHEQVEEEMVAAIVAAMEGATDPVELLVAGAQRFLDLCLDPTWTQIPLIDAPSVLGWREWREVDMRHGLGLISAGLQGGMDAGVLRVQPVLPLAHMLLAALSEAGLMVATATDPSAARKQVEPTILGMIESLRADPA